MDRASLNGFIFIKKIIIIYTVKDLGINELLLYLDWENYM